MAASSTIHLRVLASVKLWGHSLGGPHRDPLGSDLEFAERAHEGATTVVPKPTRPLTP